MEIPRFIVMLRFGGDYHHQAYHSSIVLKSDE
jgi:hypothetical protein